MGSIKPSFILALKFTAMKSQLFIFCLLLPLLSRSEGKITLQPDSTCGKDACVWNAPPTSHGSTNYGDGDFLGAHSWTNSGIPDTSRSLLEFDLSSLPAGTVVNYAHLSLFNNPTTAFAGGAHSTLSGSNAAYIRRIVTPWNEHTVTWFTQPVATLYHEVSIPASTGPHDDYINIDVTQLVQDMIDSAQSSYGFEIRLVSEEYYRALVFASSDCADPALRPRLEVSYTLPVSGCFVLQPHDGCGVDALIWNAPGFSNGTTNYGDNDAIGAHAWTNTGIPDTGRTLLYFDLGVLPAGTNLTGAYLSLWSNPTTAYAGGQSSSLSGPNNGLIQRITSPWDELSVTWMTRPTVTTLNQVVTPPTAGLYGDLLNIDVTPLVTDMLANPSTSFGFQLRLQDEAFYRSLVFTSSDAVDPTRAPRLELCFDNTTGLDSPLSRGAVRIFPNPTTGNVTVESGGWIEDMDPVKACVFDCTGHIVFEAAFVPHGGRLSESIELGGQVSTGLYSLLLTRKSECRRASLVIY